MAASRGKKSIKRVSDTAKSQDARARTKVSKARDKVSQGKQLSTKDSFVNFAVNLGIGTDNPMSGSNYGFNPITRQRTMLEWIHRGSWLGGMAVDVVADDMTRAGVEVSGLNNPEKARSIHERATELGVWSEINDTIKWSRLYGGCIAVMLIDGQDPSSPLRLDTIRKNQFCGLLVLDRWMVEPSMSDLVTDMGPNLGLPKYYHVTAQAPAMCNQKIHYSRCMRLEGVRLPYWQRLMENLWGLSELERLYDRMVAFDSATTGAAQLVYKSYLRTLKVKGLREVVAAGGPAMDGLTKYVDMMRRFQSIEGLTVLDGDDEFSADTHGAFSGLSDALTQFGQQLAGALGIPLVRLFGQSPAGFNTGDTDLQNYYDTIQQKQMRQLKVPVTRIYRAIAASEGIDLEDSFEINFNSLWQLSDTDKAQTAQTTASAVAEVYDAGLITKQTAIKELKESSGRTGVFSNISDEEIKAAEETPVPSAEGLLPASSQGEGPETPPSEPGGEGEAVGAGATASPPTESEEEISAETEPDTIEGAYQARRETGRKL